jgi:hypothetical protein
MQYKKVKNYQNQKKAEKNVELGKHALIDFKSCTLEKYHNIYEKYEQQKSLKNIFNCISEKFRFFSEIDNSFELKARLIAYKNLISSSNKLINKFNFISSSLLRIEESLKDIILFISKNRITAIRKSFEKRFYSLSKNVLENCVNVKYDNRFILISRKITPHIPKECHNETDLNTIKDFRSNIINLLKEDNKKIDIEDFYKTMFEQKEEGDPSRILFEDLYQKNIYSLQTELYINEYIEFEFFNLNFIILELVFLFSETNIKNNKGWSYNEKIICLIINNIERIQTNIVIESSKYLEKIDSIKKFKKNFEKKIINLNTIFDKHRDTIINELNNFIEQENDIYEYYQYTK